MYRCEKYLAPSRLDSSSCRVGMVYLVLSIYLLTSVMSRLATVLWSEDHITAPICRLISYILYVFGLVVDHTVSSSPGDFVYFIALLFIPLLTFLSLRIATCHHLTSLLDYFRQLAVSCTDFRSATFQINSLFSSLLPFFITASMMIVFSIVIGNSQCNPCSLQFISKSACGKSGGHLMLKSLYYSKVMFGCASTWLFNFWACDS